MADGHSKKPREPLLPGNNPDVGGIPARIGFKYQDHVAAHFCLQMLNDRRIIQVECETSDDISILRAINANCTREYIQVKSTDRDSKWNLSEISRRSNPKTESSLSEKSLLCDRFEASPIFRIVAQRSVYSSISILMEPMEHRDPAGPIMEAAESIYKKHPKTISKNGNDLKYWTKHVYWHVIPTIQSLEDRNYRLIGQLADDYSVAPSQSSMQSIYANLLDKVDSAARASNARIQDKIIIREDALDWWKNQIELARQTSRHTAKPYLVRGDRFFAQIHTMDHPPGKRLSSSYDAQFERRVWRSNQLARHLSNWVPEVALKASEIVEIDQLHLQDKLEAGFNAIKYTRPVDVDQLLGETLLHAVLRHWFGSEPIACKLFNRSRFGDKITRNAHIVHTPDGDQLWLGRVRLYEGSDIAGIIDGTREELAEGMDTDVLHEERNIILHLREPQHLTSNTLEDALEPGSPIDRLLSVLCFPLLIAYDSDVLALGHKENYQTDLLTEAKRFAESFVASLPPEVDEIQVHIFLVPIEKLDALRRQFASHVGVS